VFRNIIYGNDAEDQLAGLFAVVKCTHIYINIIIITFKYTPPALFFFFSNSNLLPKVFDEFHYMNDPDRGTVWEESVISCPKHVRILALSATMVCNLNLIMIVNIELPLIEAPLC